MGRHRGRFCVKRQVRALTSRFVPRITCCNSGFDSRFNIQPDHGADAQVGIGVDTAPIPRRYRVDTLPK
jgi:hypothetical protein